MRDVRREYGLPDEAGVDVYVDGVGLVRDVPRTSLHRASPQHGGRSRGGALPHGEEVNVDLKHGRWARGVVQGSAPGRAREAASQAQQQQRRRRLTEASPVGYHTLAAAAARESAASATGGAGGGGGESDDDEGGPAPMAATRLVAMMGAFKEDVRRLSADKARLEAAERRRVDEERRLAAEREALRAAVAQTKALREVWRGRSGAGC